MTFRLVVRPEAEKDLKVSYGWYEKRRHGLGDEFLLAVEAAIKGITHNPFSFQNVLPGVHRALVRRFPYGVFYTVKDDLIVVLAVFHGRRSPENWRKRG